MGNSIPGNILMGFCQAGGGLIFKMEMFMMGSLKMAFFMGKEYIIRNKKINIFLEPSRKISVALSPNKVKAYL